MLTGLVITDVTRMHGTRVCVAGIANDGRSIRPVLPYPGIQEDWLYLDGKCVIQPFAKVTMDLQNHQPQPPHTEDWYFDPSIKKFDGLLEYQDRRTFLQGINCSSVSDIFGAEIHTDFGHYIRENEGRCSLGTINPKTISFVRYQNERNEYRITFTDSANREFNLAVTDLTYRYYVDSLQEIEGFNDRRIGLHLLEQLSQSETFLRIGLTRPTWEVHPNCCFLQITGVYTFPDYLEGRNLEDFHPIQQNEDVIPF